MRKTHFLLALGIAVPFLLAGCAKKQDSNEVVMWLVGSQAQAKSINYLGEQFTKETGIKVRCESISWGEAHSKYLTSIAGGVPPDIGTMGLTWGAEFGDLGTMVDLKKTFPEDIEGLKKATFKSLWDTVDYRGKVFGIPLDLTMHLLYYRNDIIKTPPATWEELTVLLGELKKQGKGMLIDWGSLEWIGYSPFLWQAGGEYYNEDYTSSKLDSPEALKAMRFFTDLYRLYNIPKTAIPIEQGMRTGDFPIAISGNWKIIGLTVGAPEIAGKWSIATMPKGPSGRGTAFIGGRIMGIFQQSMNKENAWKFMKHLFKSESQVYLYSKLIETQDAYLPPNTDSWAILDTMHPEFKRVLLAQANDAEGPPPVVGWDNIARYIDQGIQRIVLENASIEDEMKKLKKIIDMESNKK